MSKTTHYLVGLGGALLALTVAGLMLHLPRVDVGLTSAQRETTVGLLVVAGLIYLGAVFVVLRHTSSRRAILIVIGIAVAMRLAFVFAHPVLSSDVYRYVWDGQVQNAGINPYRYVPTDSALKHLRDRNVFPLINRADYAHTIYPPAAQVIFGAVGRITGSVMGMKLAMVGLEALACWCMLQLLAMAGLPAERILILCLESAGAVVVCLRRTRRRGGNRPFGARSSVSGPTSHGVGRRGAGVGDARQIFATGRGAGLRARRKILAACSRGRVDDRTALWILRLGRNLRSSVSCPVTTRKRA